MGAYSDELRLRLGEAWTARRERRRAMREAERARQKKRREEKAAS